MADIDVGQLANSLGNALSIFFQERRRQAGEAKQDERFEKQHQLFLQGKELDRDREARLARQSEANIADQKAKREQAQRVMLVNLAAQTGVENATKVAEFMGASPEMIASLSQIAGIQAASRTPPSSTSMFQSLVADGATFEQAIAGAADPQSVDSSKFPKDPNKLDPLAFRLLLEGKLTREEAQAIDSISDDTFDSMPVELQALLPGALAKLKEGAEQPGALDTKRLNELITLQEKIARREQLGEDTSELEIAKQKISEELLRLQGASLTEEETVRARQQGATRAKERQTVEQRERARTQIQALEPTTSLPEDVVGARERNRQGRGTITDLFKSFVGTPKASIGSSINKLLFNQSFEDVRTGQVVVLDNDANIEIFQRAVKAGILKPLARGEGGKRLLRQGAESGGGDLLRRLGGLP